MTAILSVRIKSHLSAEEVSATIDERLASFREVPGLIQKVFGRDAASGDICGIYFFEDEATLRRYRESNLAKSIPQAYAATDVRREVYEMLRPLYPEHGAIG